MNFNKWLLRKYPKSYKFLIDTYSKDYLESIKIDNGRVAVLTKDEAHYKKGTKFIVRVFKEYEEDKWTGDFRAVGLFKCSKYFIESGYHSMELYGKSYI